MTPLSPCRGAVRQNRFGLSVAQQHTLLCMFMIHCLQEIRQADTLQSEVNQC